MEDLHLDVAARSETLRQQARGRREKKAHVRLAKFALGDFVLLGKIIKFPNKLALNWKGPYRVSRVESDYVMEVQQLVEPFWTLSTRDTPYGPFQLSANLLGNLMIFPNSTKSPSARDSYQNGRFFADIPKTVNWL
ncbi:hypothetical protein DYB28_008982 [Aphanomyces astaci]|uniref:Integrase zinc-binding domain-containing protein n=1 Tax=Aphanomyces astaci TaxID=112090 RepID=A0A9X8ED10_APHAT|nr:hypothetical protein DYB28_008982 [Aphanomyces astaci]